MLLMIVREVVLKGGEWHHLLGVTVYFGALDQSVIMDFRDLYTRFLDNCHALPLDQWLDFLLIGVRVVCSWGTVSLVVTVQVIRGQLEAGAQGHGTVGIMSGNLSRPASFCSLGILNVQ